MSLSQWEESALITCLDEMDVPSVRLDRKDWRWMQRNLQIRNKNHPLFEVAMVLLRRVK
jgi:hypothetical protein